MFLLFISLLSFFTIQPFRILTYYWWQRKTSLAHTCPRRDYPSPVPQRWKNEYQNATGTAPILHNDVDATTPKVDDNSEDKHQGSPWQGTVPMTTMPVRRLSTSCGGSCVLSPESWWRRQCYTTDINSPCLRLVATIRSNLHHDESPYCTQPRAISISGMLGLSREKRVNIDVRCLYLGDAVFTVKYAYCGTFMNTLGVVVRYECGVCGWD